MGGLTDFVIANRVDAQDVCDSDCTSRDFFGLDAKGIDTVKLGVLHSILTGDEFDPSFMGNLLCSGGEDGPWVMEVPAELVQRLAGLDRDLLRSVGAKWATTEEFSPRLDNWSPDAVQQILHDLAALCSRAVEEGKAMLMWVCL